MKLAGNAEWDSVMAVVRYAAGTTSAAAVSQLAERVTDWPSFERRLRNEGLTLLAARALAESGQWTGREEASVLTSSAALLAARSLAQFQQLTVLCLAFERASVPVLPYKGPLLSHRLYGDLALRTSTDLDLVVTRESYSAARGLLISRGLLPRRGHTDAQEKMLFHWLGQASFGQGDASFVELHWRFAPHKFPFALSPRVALARSRMVSVGEQSFRMMSDDDLVVTLAMHGTRHVFERLEWLAGFTRLLMSTNVSPDTLLEHATRLHARRMLLIAVGLAGMYAGFPLTREWREAIDDDARVRTGVAWLTGDIARRGAGVADVHRGLRLQERYAGMMDSAWDTRRLMLSGLLLPTEREWEAVRLPAPLMPLYFVLRPLRLASRALLRASGAASPAAADT